MITLSLETTEVQLILNVLSAQPFKDVGTLVPKILSQANAQVAPPPSEPAAS